LISNKFKMGREGEKVGSRRGRSEGSRWRGRIKGVEGGYFTALEGLVGVGELCTCRPLQGGLLYKKPSIQL
jgi:hypothetical protein